MTAEHVDTMRQNNLNPLTALVLEVPDVVVEDRVSFRRYDPETGKLYHMSTNPAPLGVGARCITRPGESTDEILSRLEKYHQTLRPVMRALRTIEGFMEISIDVDVQEDELETLGEDVARKIDKEMP